MNSVQRKVLYRLFCVLSLGIAVYLVMDLKISGTLNMKMIVVFILLLAVIIWGTVDWKLNSDIIREQEKELKMYQLYIRPMEELVKEIRANQHEFDNHLNAILNLHFTVDTYDELVKCQSEYIRELSRDGGNQLLPLLKISDKVLAGFLYSKIAGENASVETLLEVRSREIISRVSEHSLIEIVGVLVDNAYEACLENGGPVQMILDSQKDRLYFQIKNPYEKCSFEEIGRFFEKGYTTKSKKPGARGLGLYRAKMLTEKAGGEIEVGQEELEGKNYIQFTVLI